MIKHLLIYITMYCINGKQVQCYLIYNFLQELIKQSGKQAEDKDSLEQGLEAMMVRVLYKFVFRRSEL